VAPYLLLYAVVYAAYGIEGPFLPALLAERGLSAEAIGLFFALGTAARLLSAPLAAAVADRIGAPRLVLAAALLASALTGCALALASDILVLLVVGVLLSVALAPVNPMADALASRAATAAEGRGSGYGLVRGTGSAAFVGAAMLAGPLVVAAGLTATLWANAGLLLAATVLVLLCLPRQAAVAVTVSRHDPVSGAAGRGAFRHLLGMPLFRRLLLVTGLVQGSHALYGAFATLHWQAAGIGPETIGALWSVAVASEVGVFFLVGPWLQRRIGPAGLAGLAAVAGVLRWSTMACTDALPVQFALQPLHGLTFAALHLATMRLLADTVPPHLATSAFGLQASLGPGLAGTLLTLAAGTLYGNFGGDAFWAMAALCALALPLCAKLAEPGARPTPAVGAALPPLPAADTPPAAA
jgi:PPP family 3-phenylpropionic acid transporter